MRRPLVHLACLPANLLGWSILLVVRLLWGRAMWRRDGVVLVELAPDSWPARTWYRGWGATTFGRGMMFGPGRSVEPRLWAHELHHVSQFEASQVLGATLAGLVYAGGAAWWAWTPMLFGGWLVYGAASLTAWLRGRHAYEDNHLEVAARAVAAFEASDE